MNDLDQLSVNTLRFLAVDEVDALVGTVRPGSSRLPGERCQQRFRSLPLRPV